MVRTFDFPYEKPFRRGRKTAFHHVTFDDFGFLDDDDALYYADCLLNLAVSPRGRLALDSFDFIQKFPFMIFSSALVDDERLF